MIKVQPYRAYSPVISFKGENSVEPENTSLLNKEEEGDTFKRQSAEPENTNTEINPDKESNIEPEQKVDTGINSDNEANVEPEQKANTEIEPPKTEEKEPTEPELDKTTETEQKTETEQANTQEESVAKTASEDKPETNANVVPNDHKNVRKDPKKGISKEDFHKILNKSSIAVKKGVNGAVDTAAKAGNAIQTALNMFSPLAGFNQTNRNSRY